MIGPRIHGVQGNSEEAYRWLQEAIDAGWRNYYDPHMGPRDPLLENLRADQRFQRMMAQVRAEVDEMRGRVEDGTRLSQSAL